MRRYKYGLFHHFKTVTSGITMAMLILNTHVATAGNDDPTEEQIEALNRQIDTMDKAGWWDTPSRATSFCLFKRKTDQLGDAASICDRALELDPDGVDTLFEVGMFRRAEGRHKDSVPLLMRASELGHKQAPTFAAASLTSLGLADLAIEVSRLARAVAPEFGRAWYIGCVVEVSTLLDTLEGSLSRPHVQSICDTARKRGMGPEVDAFFAVPEIAQAWAE